MKETIKQQKLAFLEGVRGVAAVIVVFHHFGLAFFPAINYLDKSRTRLGDGSLELMIARSPLNIFFSGGFAVAIFFILSGFVLSYKFHESHDYRILKTSAAKRYFRLLVPVSAIILICYLLYVFQLYRVKDISTITGASDWAGGLFTGLGGIGDMLKNIFIDVFFNNDNRYNAVLWTMTIELLG
jgi:peptidoglycan/LPS O-acetylase OafA/YrhL